MEPIVKAEYIWLDKDITYHSSINFVIDIGKQENGKGTLRANPSPLKYPNYVILINKIIYNDILEAIDQTNSTLYNEAKNRFLEMITVQEEILKVEMLQNETDWPLN